MDSLNIGTPSQERHVGHRVLEVGVVLHGPDDLLQPARAAARVGHHQNVVTPPLRKALLAAVPTDPVATGGFNFS